MKVDFCAASGSSPGCVFGSEGMASGSRCCCSDCLLPLFQLTNYRMLLMPKSVAFIKTSSSSGYWLFFVFGFNFVFFFFFVVVVVFFFNIHTQHFRCWANECVIRFWSWNEERREVGLARTKQIKEEDAVIKLSWPADLLDSIKQTHTLSSASHLKSITSPHLCVHRTNTSFPD